MLKASSLLYAIFICLVVSLLCGSLILIFNYQYRLKQQFFLENELVTYSETSFLKIIDQLNTSEIQNSELAIFSEDNRLKTNYSIAKWGFYDLVKTKTFFKKDTIYKTGLIGGKTVNNKLALYLTDYNTALKIGGTSKIIGDVKVSTYGVEQAYINNQNFVGATLVQGNIGVSKDQLPKLNIAVSDAIIEKELYYNALKNQKLYNSFYEPTIRVIVEGTYDFSDIDLSGNFIIESKDALVISETARLKEVLIKAPKVTFKPGFSGNVQIIAKERVHVMKDVNLLYPSSIYINNDDEDNPIDIYLGENSKLAGGIVLTGNTYEGSLNRLVTIEENAEVLGDIYCYGKTQLKGKVIGTVYTDRFYLVTPGATYENHIVNGTINKLEQPNYFIGLPLFTNITRVYELIKEL